MTKAALFTLTLALCSCIPLDDPEGKDDTAQTHADDTGAAGDVELEPNDTMELAQELILPAQIQASIDPAEDVDWYRFVASEDFTVSITAVEETLELYIDVFDATDNNIASWDTNARGATFSDSVSVSGEGTFHVKIESAYADDTGTYTVLFE
jgi:hypothetical protein